MQLPDSFSSDHSLSYKEGRHVKPQFIIFFLYNSWIRKFLSFPNKVENIKIANLRTTFVWGLILKTANLSKETVAILFHQQQIPALCWSSLYTGANLTIVSGARSRLPWFHLTTGSQRIPPHVMFFSCRICSIWKPVISVDHSLAKMCFPLPRVHMCLHCGGRQKLWLTVVMNSILAATQTSGRLHTHLSHLYR